MKTKCAGKFRKINFFTSESDEKIPEVINVV